MKYLLPALVLSLANPCILLQAEDGNKVVIVDPEKAKDDADFAVQGEYAGKLGADAVGVQVIAEGGGKFALVLYPGGLPGAGWDGKKEARKKGNAQTKDGSTAVEIDGKKGEIKAGKLTIDGGALEKVSRQSPTLGAKPPEGAKVLFDGKSADAWEGGKLDGDLLEQGVTSKEKFQSYTLHLEFRLSFMPYARGQGRGNSGLYNQSRYEVQMLDSFGLEGMDNECGGIYSIKPPDLNMCLPPLVWQTYDVDYTAAKFEGSKKTASARITVKHNGVVIHQDVELPHNTTAAPLAEGPEPGPLHLQNHGNPMRYRNIWIVEKK